jgi:ADP-heptose:LPS heptosyltransferase
MSRRQRWTPVKGTGNRVYDPLERAALALLDLPGRALAPLLRGAAPATGPIREVLVLRLDRIGDVVMSLPALAALRAALPAARIRLAVGRWSEPVARLAPVDDVLVWSAPWVGRAHEGADSLSRVLRAARALASFPIDLALDLQGDVRASLLLWLCGARQRVGYANTGGAYLLTRVVALDETVSWVEQSRRAVAVALGEEPPAATADPLGPAGRERAARLAEELGVAGRHPLVGIHPSGGRPVKQWPVARWAEVGRRLQREFGATLVLTGGTGDRALTAELARGLPDPPVDVAGRFSVPETLALLSSLDLFLSPDTGPMHMACAVGTPSVSLFGPSDPARYFSGGSGRSGERHVVVRPELWCAPCNLIRKPPSECVRGEAPECLRLVTPEQVFAEAARVLREQGGYAPRAGS